jgi:hypothetical protein
MSLSGLVWHADQAVVRALVCRHTGAARTTCFPGMVVRIPC